MSMRCISGVLVGTWVSMCRGEGGYPWGRSECCVCGLSGYGCLCRGRLWGRVCCCGVGGSSGVSYLFDRRGTRSDGHE